jgi:hypothetical protein
MLHCYCAVFIFPLLTDGYSYSADFVYTPEKLNIRLNMLFHRIETVIDGKGSRFVQRNIRTNHLTQRRCSVR